MDITLNSCSSSQDGEAIDFHKVPIRALNISSRLALSRYLNPEMVLPTSDNLARDYRGLAEQLGFAFIDLQNFQRSSDPMSKLLEAWEMLPGSTIGMLLEKLEAMEREDVILETKLLLEKDARAYLRYSRSTVAETPLQVAEVSSCPISSLFPTDNPNHLTLADVCCEGSELAYYDAFVCYADENREFVFALASLLEHPDIGIKLCLRDRDLLLGTMSHDTLVRLIEERCNRMLVILSPEFLQSSECEFQTRFAAGLAIEQRQRKIIPIIYKPCAIPPLLRYVTKVDATKSEILEWILRKLIVSIKGTGSRDFVQLSTIPTLSSLLNHLASISPAWHSGPQSLPAPPPTFLSLPSASSTTTSGISSGPPSLTSASSSSMSSLAATAPSHSPVPSRRNPLSILRAFTSRISSTSTTASSSATNTSGFQSQSIDSENQSNNNWKNDEHASENVFYSNY